MEIRIQETLTLLKVRGVIEENTLLKYQKLAMTIVLNEKGVFMLLPNPFKKSAIYQVLPFIISTGHLIDRFLIRNLTGVSIMCFIPGWESEIVN